MTQTNGKASVVEQPKCKDLVKAHLESRMDDLRQLWKAYCDGNEDGVEDLGNIYEYGLSFDYVAPETFNGQRRGYWRYQLSWGGPSEEFRFFCDENRKPVRIEFWYMDWFDGAKKVLRGKNEALMLEIWDWFDECGTAEHAQKEALA